MSVEKILREEVEKEYELISEMELGSEQYNNTVKGTGVMIDKMMEYDKIRNEERRLDIEERKLETEKKNGIVKNIITGVTFAVGTIVTVWANIDSKKFERSDTHTTEAGRQSTRKLLGFMDKFKA